MTTLPVRFLEGDFSARCAICREWLPLTVEFWYPKVGLGRCRSCFLDVARLKQRGYMLDEAVRRVSRFKGRLRYQSNREERLEKNRAWKERNHDRVRDYRRAHYHLSIGDPEPMQQYRASWPDARLRDAGMLA